MDVGLVPALFAQESLQLVHHVAGVGQLVGGIGLVGAVRLD